MTPVQAELGLRHLALMASAGSGKTFRLSSRFIELVEREEPPDRILASTFTRLAAGEIRDRILHRLARAALDPQERQRLGRSIAEGGLERDRVLALLQAIARRLHRLQIRTLDSFCHGIVQAFALELGLPPDARIIDEPADVELRRLATTRALDVPDPQPWVELLRVLTEGGTDRSVAGLIDETVASLYSLHQETEPAAWQWMRERPCRPQADLDAALATLQKTRPDATDKRGLKAHREDCARIAACGHADAGGWRAFISKGLAAPIVAQTLKYHGKPIDREVVKAYQPFITHARAVLWNHLAHRTRSTHQLLERFHERYRQVKREHLAIAFDDLAALLVQARHLGTFDEICFRLDARVRHLLLDEFQDTSIMQWRALAPLIEEIVSDGTGERTFFCVGDVKQSIYGWRDAAPEILVSLPRLLGDESILLDQLRESRRSAPEIIDTVNRVFGSVAGNRALGPWPDAVDFWTAIFQPHTTARSDLAGYAELRTVRPPAEGETEAQVPLLEAARLIGELHEADRDRSIGVLLRTNRAVGRMLYELGPTRRNVPATGRGGGALTDAAAVNAILDALRLADHPEHTVAAFNLMHSPLGPVLGLTGGGGSEAERARRLRVARQVRRATLDRGYAATFEEWIAAIAAKVDRREIRRLEQLLELADRLDRQPPRRPAQFAAIAAALTVDDPATSPVRVMTIHQAKGLEFDVVVLPDLQTRIVDTRHLMVAVERTAPAGPVTRVVRWVSSADRRALPELDGLFGQQITRLAREGLCLLYVAMTRARQGLFMLVPAPGASKSAGAQTGADVLINALASEAPAPDRVLFSSGERDWLGHRREQEETSPPINRGEPEPVRLAPPAGLPRPAPAPSALGGGAGSLEAALRLSDVAITDHGTAMHKLLEQVEWLEEFHPDPVPLIRLLQRALPRRQERWARRVVGEFLDLLRQPTMRRVLSRRGRDPGTLQVWRELPFAAITKGRLQSGLIDRLEAVLEAGAPRQATVLDFKTDRVEPLFAAPNAERYRAQLEIYRDAAAARLRLDRSQVAMQVLFVTADVIVTL